MQSKNKNDGVQLSTRYEQYCFAKRHLRGTRRPEVFPFGESDEVSSVREQDGIQATKEIVQDVESGRGCTNSINQLNQPTHSNDRVYGTDGVSPTLNTMQGGNRQPFIAAQRGRYDKEGKIKQQLEKRKDNISNTITSVEKDNRVCIPEATKKGYAEAEVGDSINLSVPNSKTRRGRVGKGIAQTLDTGMQQHTLHGARIRRLTPTECERLQGFPDVEKSVILQVCTENLNNPAYVESQSRKLQKLVGSVEKNNSQDNVVSATESLITSSQQTSKPAQPDVLINCVENGVEIHSQGRLLLNARGVAKKNWSPQHMEIEDFVQVVAGINTILEKITKHGGVESHLNEQCLILQKNGKKFVRLCGKEMTQLAEDVKNDSTTLKELLKSITSDHSDIKSLEQRLITLFSFVSLAIVGYIPTEIQSQSICTIEIKSKLGWTFGISDTQRYKACGNAVSCPVIQHIVEKLAQIERDALQTIEMQKLALNKK